MAEEKRKPFSGGGGGAKGENISDYVGQLLEIVNAEVIPGADYDAVTFEAVTEGGDIVTIWSSAKPVVEDIKAALEDADEYLPATVKVVDGPGKAGKRWYALRDPEGLEEA